MHGGGTLSLVNDSVPPALTWECSTTSSAPPLPLASQRRNLNTYLQERIIAEEYIGEDGVPERFKATMFIVMCNRCVTCVVAGVLLLLSGQSLLPQAPIWNFVAVSGVCKLCVQTVVSLAHKQDYCQRCGKQYITIW